MFKRINVIADFYGDKIYLNLGITYFVLYSPSSERMHSSLFGAASYVNIKDKKDFFKSMIYELTGCISGCGIVTIGLLETLEKESGIEEFSRAAKELSGFIDEIIESVDNHFTNNDV